LTLFYLRVNITGKEKATLQGGLFHEAERLVVTLLLVTVLCETCHLIRPFSVASVGQSHQESFN